MRWRDVGRYAGYTYAGLVVGLGLMDAFQREQEFKETGTVTPLTDKRLEIYLRTLYDHPTLTPKVERSLSDYLFKSRGKDVKPGEIARLHQKLQHYAANNIDFGTLNLESLVDQLEVNVE